MIKFSEILLENKTINYEVSIDTATEYYNKVKLPRNIKIILKYLIQNNILKKSIVEEIISANKSQLQSIAKKLNLNFVDLSEIQRLIDKRNNDILLLPMLLSEEDLNALLNGDKKPEDITIDLESEHGRNNVAKLHMKTVFTIAKKYKELSNIDYNTLISAGTEGLANAMKDYKKPEYFANLEDNTQEARKYKKLSFRQYANYRIMQAILGEINLNSGVVKYTGKKSRPTDVRIDRMFGDDEDSGSKVDRFLALSETPDSDFDEDSESNKTKAGLNKLQQLLEKKFSQRNCLIFYKTFGLFGYNITKQKEIAKELNVTPANVNITLKKMIDYIKSTPAARESIQLIYNTQLEHICIKNINNSKQQIFDAIISNDYHLLLEDLIRFNDKYLFNNIIESAISNFNESSKEFISNCLLNEIDFIEENYNNESKQIISEFLTLIYPTKNISNYTDIDIIESMTELSDKYKEHNI